MQEDINLTAEERRAAAHLISRQLHDISTTASRLGWAGLARLASIASAEARRTALKATSHRSGRAITEQSPPYG